MDRVGRVDASGVREGAGPVGPGGSQARVGPAPAPLPTGLTGAEAARRLAEHGPNVIPEPPPPKTLHRVLAQLRDPMIMLLLGAAVLTVALRDWTDFTVIALVVVLNTAVGVAQEVRAERAVAALRRLGSPVARVVRDGRDVVLAAADLVVGDVVRLEAGDIVPADASLLDAFQLQIDESTLTGESVPVDKDAAATDATAELLSGTVVTRGRAVAEVMRTGTDSALGRIAALIAEARPRPTPLQQRLAGLGRVLALTALVLSGIVLLSGLLRGEPLGAMTVTAVSLAVAAVPESLPAVVTLALALGAHRMAQRRALIRRLPAVETLGSVSVLAADKTGTLTENRMVVQGLWVGDLWYAVSGAGYAPLGDVEVAPGAEHRPDALDRLLRDAVLCNDADLVPPGTDHDWLPLGDPTEAALIAVAGKAGVDATTVRAGRPRSHELPFDSVRKRMTTVHPLDDGRQLVICKGAPEALLGTPGLLAADEDLAGAAERADRLAHEGFRVLAIADATRSEVPPGHEEEGLRLVGLVAIADPPRAGAEDVIRSFQEAGVRLLLITGDHPATARAIASRLGIAGTDHAVVTGERLEAGLTDEELAEVRVFARTRPEQKLDIIKAWQGQGSVVAMTGDGVNDAPALKTADIGVAMGRGGTEVARQAADLVLTDDELSTVVAAIEEGRRIYANIRRFLRYALSGGVAEVAIMLAGPFLGFPVPLLPSQILWINMLTHGLPGVALGAEPADPEAMRETPRSPQEAVLDRTLVSLVAVTGAAIAVVTALAAGWTKAQGGPWQTSMFMTLGLAQLGVALALRQRRGPDERSHFLDVAVAVAVLLQLAGAFLPPLQLLLDTEALSLHETLQCAVLAALPGLAMALRRVVVGRRARVSRAARR
ncbi:MAG TPA: cation-transporting P-type ATPase [Actinomycetes bacterium]